MLVPAVMPEAGWSPVGTYVFKDLTKAQQDLAKKKPMKKQELPQQPEQSE
jgi:hypothetical protein